MRACRRTHIPIGPLARAPSSQELDAPLTNVVSPNGRLFTFAFKMAFFYQYIRGCRCTAKPLFTRSSDCSWSNATLVFLVGVVVRGKCTRHTPQVIAVLFQSRHPSVVR